LSDREKLDIDAEFDAINAMKNSLGKPDTEEINRQLIELEESLEFEMNEWNIKLAKLGDNAPDEDKEEYFYAKQVYDYVSKKLGPDSPAKKAAKK
jgi:hypothetical protein